MTVRTVYYARIPNNKIFDNHVHHGKERTIHGSALPLFYSFYTMETIKRKNTFFLILAVF